MVAKTEPPSNSSDAFERILSLCKQYPEGVNDQALATQLIDISSSDRAQGINKLLGSGKIDLFKAKGGLVYKLRVTSSSTAVGRSSGGDVGGDGGSSIEGNTDDVNSILKGNTEEKIVYRIIEEAGDKGTWVRDIRFKSNLIQTQLNKVLKSLKSKKLIKEVKCVNSSRKVVYMLYHLTPDSSVTGGTWYSDHDFESEFVEILNQQCYRFLESKLTNSESFEGDPLLGRQKSVASSSEILKYISDMGISTIQLKQADIDSIMDTLVYDGKVERCSLMTSNVNSTGIDDPSSTEHDVKHPVNKYYRAVRSLMGSVGLLYSPCGACPVRKRCSVPPPNYNVKGTDIATGLINPIRCPYIDEWLDSK